MADQEDIRERYAEAATRWALMYPLGNWPCLGYVGGGDARRQLDAIARDIASAWGSDIADRMLTVRDDELTGAQQAIQRVRLEVARLAQSDNIGVVRQHVIDRITAALDGGQ